MLSPAMEPKTRLHLWHGQTLNVCQVLAGSHQLQHPPTFQISRTDTDWMKKHDVR